MATVLAVASALLFVPAVRGHGYIVRPESRAYLCTMWTNRDCGDARWEPQSIEAAKGFPDSGPADGSIAGGGRFDKLDEVGEKRWRHVNLRRLLHRVNSTHNSIVFKWHYSAPHRTTNYDLFATKKDFNNSQPLTRAVLVHVHTLDSPNKQALPMVHHFIPRNMIHKVGVLLCVWVIDDTPNAFYQVIDYKLRKKRKPTTTTEEPTTARTSPTILSCNYSRPWLRPWLRPPESTVR